MASTAAQPHHSCASLSNRVDASAYTPPHAKYAPGGVYASSADEAKAAARQVRAVPQKSRAAEREEQATTVARA